jgi:hypothetical protein
MSEVSDGPSVPEDAPDLVPQFIEERYLEWEREFGERVEKRRTAGFDPRQGTMDEA